jgi:hypothetical protein
MRVVVDHQFVREARAGGLRFLCEDCVHRSPRTGRCAHDWPDEEHRTMPELEPGQEVPLSFCKEFELL